MDGPNIVFSSKIILYLPPLHYDLQSLSAIDGLIEKKKGLGESLVLLSYSISQQELNLAVKKLENCDKCEKTIIKVKLSGLKATELYFYNIY